MCWCPVRNGQRITTMTSGQKSFPCVAPMFKFSRHGENGTYVSEILPKTAELVDDITLVKSVHTEAINHDPAITFINTGVQQPGKASMGAWVSYGLGSPNKNLPSYVVMISKGPGQKQALYSRLWGSGFLPSQHQGVAFGLEQTRCCTLTIPPESIGQLVVECSIASPPLIRKRTAVSVTRKRLPESLSTKWRFECRHRSPD